MGFGSVNVGFSPQENVPGGVVVLGSDGKIPGALIPDGYATLGSDGKLAEAQRWEIDAYTKEETDQKIEDAAGQAGSGIPAGNIGWFAGATPPDGWMVCNGAAVSRSAYAALFAVLGTTFGEGDGETTFALPDLRDRVAWGSTDPGTALESGLPNITGQVYALYTMQPWDNGAFSNYTIMSSYRSGFEGEYSGGVFDEDVVSFIEHNFSAKASSPIYGKSEIVQPPALTLLPCIKY